MGRGGAIICLRSALLFPTGNQRRSHAKKQIYVSNAPTSTAPRSDPPRRQFCGNRT